jgi:hypothetical protein
MIDLMEACLDVAIDAPEMPIADLLRHADTVESRLIQAAADRIKDGISQNAGRRRAVAVPASLG